MKKISKILCFIALLFCFNSLFTVQIHNRALDDAQQQYLERLTRTIKFKAYQLCDLCHNRNNMHYKNQSDRDYNFKLEKLKKEIGLTIDDIVALYEIIGLDEHLIKQEKSELLKGLCCYESNRK